MDDSKSTAAHSGILQKDESVCGDPLDELRHNGTYTLPPGMRAEWLSKPLPRLSAEHLQATDELDPDDLATPNGALVVKPLPSRIKKRVLVLSLVAFGLVLGAALGLLTRRPKPDPPASSGNAAVTTQESPASQSDAAPPPSAASVGAAEASSTVKPPARAAAGKGHGAARGLSRPAEPVASDNADVGLFKPE